MSLDKFLELKYAAEDQALSHDKNMWNVIKIRSFKIFHANLLKRGNFTT